MKKALLAIAVIAACAAAYFLLQPKPAPAPPTPAPAPAPLTQVAPTAIPPPATSAPAVATPVIAPVLPAAILPPASPPAPSAPHPLQFTNFPAEAAVRSMSIAIHSYCSMFNGNPVGTNPEITRALSGHNPRQANFIQPEAGMRINGNGELVDPWGTPYFFHQLSGHDMEVRSAGPDGVMWTADDLVAR
jgi:hypothetical protein